METKTSLALYVIKDRRTGVIHRIAGQSGLEVMAGLAKHLGHADLALMDIC